MLVLPPLVSIIIPVFNTEKVIKKCIDSVLKQSYTNWEMILVDDGSPDNAGKICDEYAAKDDRIKVIHKQNEGLSEARNTGLDYISKNSVYVSFLDSDDELEQDALNKICSFIDEGEPDVVLNTVNRHDINKNSLSVDVCDFPTGTRLNEREIANVFFERGLLCLSDQHINTCGFCLQSHLYKTKFLKYYNIRFCEKQPFGEDVRFCADVYSHANNVVFSNIPLFKYNYDSSAVSKKYAEKYARATIEAYKYQTKIIKKLHLGNQAKLARTGRCWVGIKSFILTSINRKRSWINIYKTLYNPSIVKCFFSVIFAKNSLLKFALLSRKQKIAAFLFLLGMYRIAYKLS